MADPGLPVFGTLASWLLTLFLLAGASLFWETQRRLTRVEARLEELEGERARAEPVPH